VRIIAASNQDLWEAVRRGKFREDLYFRLSGVEIHMPPLRERREDIPLLAEHFLRQYGAEKGLKNRLHLDEELIDALLLYDWPGNVRELRQSIRAACALADAAVRVEHLPRRIGKTIRRGITTGAVPAGEASDEQRYLAALQATAFPGTGRWNLSAAARKLGIPRKTFVYRLDQMRGSGVLPE